MPKYSKLLHKIVVTTLIKKKNNLDIILVRKIALKKYLGCYNMRWDTCSIWIWADSIKKAYTVFTYLGNDISIQVVVV